MIFAVTYMTIGILVCFFSRDLARGMNWFSVKFYDAFPLLKKAMPLSRLAGSTLNYKSSLYFYRGLGSIMILAGVVALGFVLLYRL